MLSRVAHHVFILKNHLIRSLVKIRTFDGIIDK